ncbi:MAG: bifunctional DNA-formamidopyrimidine glycosylase/DNA-(apurinic or apyrimidinic site) lyase [Bacillota bacterium]|nr:bifunctional DNA-formamidopyrimidine glycosylase/DNA-(apurinic or apyrimidinic site) lyase [Bacillota bacterium]
MPELPEVETIRRTLATHLVGERLERVEVLHPHFLVGVAADRFARLYAGARVEELGRRGKYLIVRFAAGLPAWLVHLRMTGRLYVRETAPEPGDDPHLHLRARLAGGGWLLLRDVRKFARLYLLAAGPAGGGAEAGAFPLPPGWLRLGPDALGDELTPARLERAFAGRRAPVKALLLDQRLLAGLGNIYSDEALWRARLHPARAGGSLRPAEIRRLWAAIRSLLEEAIDWRGTTFSDYLDGEGFPGGFAIRLQAYGRAGQPCRRCGSRLESLRLGGRSATFCPRCQRRATTGDRVERPRTR